MNKKTLYLYTGDHIIHRKFAESVGAEIFPMSWNIPKGYDIYFSEGEFFRIGILKFIGRINRNSKIINLFSDPRLFYLDKRIKYDTRKQRLKRSFLIKNFILKKLLSKFDGIICVGNFEKEILNRNYNGPCRKVDIFVDKKFQLDLFKVKPKLSSKNVIFIGNGPDISYKGVDLILNVAEINPKINFTIVGGYFDDFLRVRKKPKNVLFVGHMKMNSKEIKKSLEESSLYLHLGRGEAFGVTVLEAMSAGLPCIVSNLTGAREAVSKVEPDFVVSLDVKEISNKINEYFDKSIKEKKILSNKFRKVSKFYNEKDQLRNFKVTFNNLVEEIYEGRI